MRMRRMMVGRRVRMGARVWEGGAWSSGGVERGSIGEIGRSWASFSPPISWDRDDLLKGRSGDIRIIELELYVLPIPLIPIELDLCLLLALGTRRPPSAYGRLGKATEEEGVEEPFSYLISCHRVVGCMDNLPAWMTTTRWTHHPIPHFLTQSLTSAHDPFRKLRYRW
jgi:hypothetical protein